MSDAENYCKDFGGHLASIHHDGFTVKGSQNHSIWIGLRQKADSTADKPDAFQWTDGTNVNFTNFRKSGSSRKRF